ncbi:ataxin-1-like [Drosophila albomicans]|uniref:Ataxin-1-like n=1 Tax=Drosophila albomicans TaxID=7291 RepID=A0A6P8XLB7_DROAB|nr:ataxin-1-like [Drosophila albomicans]
MNFSLQLQLPRSRSSELNMNTTMQMQHDAANQQSHDKSCFHKGSYIELSTGVMRRVEDIRTEDFIQSALRSPHFQLLEATVVKIDRTSAGPNIIITFSYATQHLKVNMEVTASHPLFVYGQGWASCDPQLSLQLYALKCQQLQVGDICLSLVAQPEQPPPPPPPPSLPMAGNYAFDASSRHPYQMYAEMANIVAAYTQHLIGKMRN